MIWFYGFIKGKVKDIGQGHYVVGFKRSNKPGKIRLVTTDGKKINIEPGDVQVFKTTDDFEAEIKDDGVWIKTTEGWICYCGIKTGRKSKNETLPEV